MKWKTLKLFDVSGKVAVVTGAAGGLGAAMARGLDEAGAKVMAADIRESIACRPSRPCD